MKRVLMVGSGKRAANNFIPVLSCLRKDFEVIGVCSRQFENARKVGDAWNIPAVARIEDAPWEKVDVVIVSVPYAANPDVLSRLKKHAGNLVLLIDTPVFAIGQFRDFSLLKDFKKVLVAEDYMNFPEFEMAREFAEQGRLGAIEAIFLMNTGYRYHALAAIRSFLNFPGIVRVQAIAAANGNFFIGFRFDGGGRGYVTEPNRRFDGGWAVVGKTGILASDESCLQAGSSTLDQFVISPRWKSETDFDGFEINGTGTHQFKAVPRYNELVGLGYQNRTRLNVMRNCGLIRILESLNEDNINSRYSGYEGVYDSIASTLARRAPQLGLVGTHLALATATRLVRGRTGAGRR